MSVTSVTELARARTSAFNGYQPGRQARRPEGKLSSNESALGPAPKVIEAIADAAHRAHRYPDASPLRKAIAAHEALPESNVIVTNGSDELCYLLASLFIEAGDKVVLSDPCYQIDSLVTQLHGGEPEFIPLRADGGHDLDGMQAASQGASLVWLPTPHNPTGVIVTPDEIETFMAGVPASCVVVLDEAYRAFVDIDLQPDVRGLLGRYPNLVVQRTFSKDYALAGLRVGYGLGSNVVIDAMSRVRAPFSVNTVAVAGALAALHEQAWRDYTVAHTVSERRLLQKLFEELGVKHFVSQANFVTFTSSDPAGLALALEEAGLMVRGGADLGFPGWLRVSVGTSPVMAQLRKVLREAL